jgi:hypothetical protein
MTFADLPWLPPVLVGLLFVGMWLLVTFLLGYASGWVTLAKFYRASQPFHGTNVRVRGARMGHGPLGSYRNVITVGVNPQGILLHKFFPFKISSPDLFVPWTDVTVTRGKWWFRDYVEFRFARAPAIPLRIFGMAGRGIQEATGTAWPQDASRDVLPR